MVTNIRLLFVTLILASPVSAFAQSTAFQYDVRGVGGMYTHSRDDPASDWTLIGPPPNPEQEFDVVAFDIDSAGTLVGVDLFTNILGSIDPLTADFTTIVPLSGDIPPNVQAMTIDTSDGKAYVSDGIGLWTMNISTGVCSLVSASFNNTSGGTVATVFDLATDSAGNFWAFDITSDTLWSLDQATGDVTALGVYSGTGNPEFSNNGLDWDPVTGTLYADVYTGTGRGSYGTWDTSTGVFTEVLNHSAFPAPAGPNNIGGPIACFGGTTFHVNHWSDALAMYMTIDPATGFSQIDQPALQLFAMDFDETGNTFYAINTFATELGTIDSTTGEYTALMPVTGDWPAAGGAAVGITCDGSGQWYLTNLTTLFTLDVATGDTVMIGDFIGPPSGDDPSFVIEIAANYFGDLYIFSSGDDKLWSVDPTTAECTEVGSSAPALASNFVQGMDFDPDTGVLYSSIYSGGGTGSYGTWDLTTGTFSSIISLEALPDPPIGTTADGYELKLAFQRISDPVVVFAETLTVMPGIVAAGDLTRLTISDNFDLSIYRNPGFVESETQFVLTSTSPTATPTTFDFTLEGSCFARTDVSQRIELWDYITGAWETVDEQIASRIPAPDLSVTVSPGGDRSRFVDQTTNEIMARVRYRGNIARLQFASNTDYCAWTIE